MLLVRVELEFEVEEFDLVLQGIRRRLSWK
jgi:hypothetical protein